MRTLRSFLIVGLKELDAGKTTVARVLLACLREKGTKACGFKPKASNTLWSDYEIVHEALSRGRHYGKDAKLLRDASGTELPEELINPIHRLWATPPHNLKRNLTSLPHFIVDRIALWNEKCREVVVVNDALPFRHGRERLVARLCRPETEVIHVKMLKELNKITDEHYDKAIRLAHRRIATKHDAIAYESYSDVAIPWRDIKDLDMVLAVHPGYIQAYDPDKYLSALELSTSLLQEKKRVFEAKLNWFNKTIKSWQDSDWVPDFQVGDTRVVSGDGRNLTFGKTRLQFSLPMFHGQFLENVGWVIGFTVEYKDRRFTFTSDLEGPIIEEYAHWIAQSRPDVVVADGPPLYGYGYMIGKADVIRVVRNLSIIMSKARPKQVILDHHLCRGPFRSRLKKAYSYSRRVGVKLFTAAEHMGYKPLIEQLRAKNSS